MCVDCASDAPHNEYSAQICDRFLASVGDAFSVEHFPECVDIASMTERVAPE